MVVKQAVVVIHGMGEQRPVETLNRFSRVLTPEGKIFYSKVDRLTESFEARRHLIPPQKGLGTQTEIYEYHWAHLMQGNQVGDLLPLLRRMLLPIPGWWGVPAALAGVAAAFLFVLSLLGPPEPTAGLPEQIVLAVIAVAAIATALRYVPAGLTVLWLVIWSGIGWVAWAAVWGPLVDVVTGVETDWVRALIGGGVAALVVTYLIGRTLPTWITNSFVDVVRYLDTSPRSYQVRREIRAGIVDLLKALHDYRRYDRIVVVAHSLGSYIAYDAISHLWGEMAKLHEGPQLEGPLAGKCKGGAVPVGLAELEADASSLDGDPAKVDRYQSSQRRLWTGIRQCGNPWLITDFVSFGSPMYFADRLYTRNRGQFELQVERDELPTCPPQSERKKCNNIHGTKLFFSWNNGGHRVLHDAAPFAVVRWTNLWYPAVVGFFGDWFGGRLAPLFGNGVKDLPVKGNRPWRWVPGAAHGMYLSFAKDRREGSFTRMLSEVVGIEDLSWIPDEVPEFDIASSRADPALELD